MVHIFLYNIVDFIYGKEFCYVGDMLIQGIGLIAFALFLLSYQVARTAGLFHLAQTAGNFLFARCFSARGSGRCGRFADQLFRTLFAGGKYPILGAKFWPVLICALSLYLLAFGTGRTGSAFAVLCDPVPTIGYWSDNALKIRMFNLCCASPCWLGSTMPHHSVAAF